MTGAELDAWLVRTGRTHRELAARIDRTERTISRWVNGHAAVPRWVVLALRHWPHKPTETRQEARQGV